MITRLSSMAFSVALVFGAGGAWAELARVGPDRPDCFAGHWPGRRLFHRHCRRPGPMGLMRAPSLRSHRPSGGPRVVSERMQISFPRPERP
jgi:hypothetical protein